MIGRTVSHYKIIEKLGEGGMGVVYRAEDTKLGRVVALKFLPPELTRDSDAKGRFMQEARAASALDHPNICTIYSIDETSDGRLFISMAFYEGETLKRRIARGPLAIDEAVRIAAQIGEGLSKAHAAGIVHRDIKSANVMLTSDGLAKILDFGLAKLSGRTQQTKVGTTLGTIAYMSPEQARGAAVDHRTDIWSLGVVCYEMLTGRLPFSGEYDQAVMYAILHDEFRSLTSVRPEVPGAVGGIIEKCLEKNPEDRYRSVEQFTEEIRQLESAGHTISRMSAIQKPKEPPSIAVLPFRDMSPARDQEYFCEGIAEELINALAQIEGLRVTARTSAFQFRDKNLDVRRIGKELGVESVLEGSVRKAGTRLRITAQLISIDDGYHLWSEKYDREMEDIFAIQDEISLAIVEKLKGKLIREDKSKLGKRFTVNEEAYNIYLRGRYHYNRRYEGGMYKAIGFFQQAIEKDPLYALPYTGIADCYNQLGHYGLLDPRLAYPKAKEAVARALEIDDNLAEAHASLGWIRTFHDWDWDAAEAEFKKAIELSPNSIVAHHWYSLLLGAAGRLDESYEQGLQALALDPINLITNTVIGLGFCWRRRYAEAIDQLQKTLEMDPGFALAYLFLGYAYGGAGRWDEAAAAFKEHIALGQEAPIGIGYLGWAYAASGKKDEARALLERLDDMERERFVPSFYRAMIHMGLGDHALAFECLDRAIDERESWMVTIKTNPFFDGVRSDPRFAVLLKKAGLEK